MMRRNRYTDYIQWRADALMQGRHDDLARHYRTPAWVSVAGQVFHMNSHDEVMLELHRLRVALFGQGIVHLVPQVVAIELPRATQRVWVRWQALDRQSLSVGQSSTVYHFDLSDQAMRVTGLANQSLLIPDYAKPGFRTRLKRSQVQAGH